MSGTQIRFVRAVRAFGHVVVILSEDRSQRKQYSKMDRECVHVL